MHKFFVTKGNIYDDIATIVGDDVKHIYKVLRLQEGEKVSINNCEGIEYIGEITSVSKVEVKVRLYGESCSNNESPVSITLYQGLPKASKMDLIVQKAAEIGLKEITPLVTKRVVVQNESGEFSKTERWRRIALEACKQCKRTMIPVINTPEHIDDIITKLEEFDLIVVPYENKENFGIKQMLRSIRGNIKSIAIIIGPEGGFEESEVNILENLGAKIVTLGPRILRTETAGFVCASILQYEFGDLGGDVDNNVIS